MDTTAHAVILTTTRRGRQPRAPPTAALKSLVQRFEHEMSGLAAGFEAYVQRWPSPAAIQANAADFVKESTEMIRLLGDRIEREERDLYPRIDAA